MKIKTLLLMAVLVCSVGLSGCSSDETESPTAPPPPAPPPPPPPMSPPPDLDLICEVGACTSDPVLKNVCVEAITSCLMRDPANDDCFGYGVLICGDDNLGDPDDPGKPGDPRDPGGLF
jgi:hypothetical protein